jgi:hypothetical protein
LPANLDGRGVMKSNHRLYQGLEKYIKPAVLPVLLAVIPTLYYYGRNVDKLTPVSLYRMLAFNAILAILIYILCLVFTRFQGMKAAIAASIFLVFFNIYGVAYRYLLNLDVIRIKHYTLLPLTILLAIYAMVFAARQKDSVSGGFWKGLLPVVGLLVIFNLFNIIPVEIKRWESNAGSTVSASQNSQADVSADTKTPDIYYIILDEFEGLQGMRDYWKYQGVDDFADFLKERGFFIAENSHGDTTNTLHEMSSRLNYKEYAHVEKDYKIYFDAIADNRVVEYLKSKGYTTVVFDETKLGYPAAESLQADYLYEYGSPSIPQVRKFTFFFDEFGQLVIDNTMLYAVSQKYRNNLELINNHRNMISFTIDNIASKKVSPPKFVYVHLLLPHMPFIYDENGRTVEYEHYTNWNYYIDNYKFSTNVAEKMVDQILQEADPENPPVIILQSDHGARNYPVPRDPNSVILKDYPDDLKKLILYTLYLPGYDYSSLPQDIKPVNTFPIIFNYLFDAGIPLLK